MIGLPIGPFHRRIMLLIGIGMFFDGFDIYIAGTVLGVTLKTGFSTLAQNAVFISATFVGMMLGSFGTGFLGDRYGRRFTYQFNLLVFGLASLAAAFSPNMAFLIACRFVMGVGLGRRERRRLFDDDRIRARPHARQMARIHHRMRRHRSARRTVGRIRWWCRNSAGAPCSCSAASARSSCGTCASRCRNRRAGWKRWAAPRSGSAYASHREGSGPGAAPAGARGHGDRRPCLRDLGTLFTAALAVAHDRRLGLPDHHQHPALRLRDLAAGILRQAGPLDRDLVRLFAADGARRADRLGDRRTDRRPLGPEADHHWRIRWSQWCSASSTP